MIITYLVQHKVMHTHKMAGWWCLPMEESHLALPPSLPGFMTSAINEQLHPDHTTPTNHAVAHEINTSAPREGDYKPLVQTLCKIVLTSSTNLPKLNNFPLQPTSDPPLNHQTTHYSSPITSHEIRHTIQWQIQAHKPSPEKLTNCWRNTLVC